MRRKIIIAVLIVSGLFLIAAGVWAARYFAWFQDGVEDGEIIHVEEKQLEASQNKNVSDTPVEQPQYTIEPVAEGLTVPWSIVFTSTDRMLVTERIGNIRVIEDGVLQEEPVHRFAEVSNQSEEGLMGMALDPEYDENKKLYVCLAYPKGDTLVDKVIVLRDEGTGLTEEAVIIDDIPAAQYHAGCRLQFGPDDKLYITTGDATEKEIAQDVNSLGGKILRINADGSIPDDNPFPNSPVYSYGHRNPQGIAWMPDTDVLVSTEHGPSVFDGPAGGDEINKIEPGKNYGWPLVSHDKNKEGLTAPLIQFTPAVAPASALIYSGDLFPAWKNDLFFGALVGEGIFRVEFTDQTASKIASYEKLKIDKGRIREVMQGPDGAIYFSTSNQDSRGEPAQEDDKIYRIVPQN